MVRPAWVLTVSCMVRPTWVLTAGFAVRPICLLVPAVRVGTIAYWGQTIWLGR